MTSHIRDHISRGTAPAAHSPQTTDLSPAAADCLQAFNNFMAGLLDKGERAHRSNSFFRELEGNCTHTPSISLSCVQRRRSIVINFSSFVDLLYILICSAEALLSSPPPFPPPLPPSQRPSSVGATAGSSRVPQQRGGNVKKQHFPQNETMNEPHTRHENLINSY